MLMNLFVETLMGMSFELRVSPAESVMSVKSKIQRAEGIPVSQQHLVWQNSELEDHRRLRDYSICPDSTIRLILGLRGGPLNAPRIPPVRLTPLHFAPVMSQCRPKGSGINRTARLSRFPLPALGSQRLPTTLGLVNSFEKSSKPKGMTYPHAQLSTDNKSIYGRETPGSSTDVTNNPDGEGNRSTKTPNYRLPLIQAPISSTASAPSLMDGENTATKNGAKETWGESKTVDHLTSTRDSLLSEKSWSSKLATSSVHQSSSLNAVDIASQGSEETGGCDNPDVPTSTTSSSVLDYPPLITPNSFRSPLTRFDLPSYWRLYKPREVVLPQVRTALTTSLSTRGEHQNNGVAAESSGGAGRNPTSTVQSSSQPDEVGEEEAAGLVATTTVPVSASPSGTAAAAASAAASILTSLLSTTAGDTHHLSLSYQTNDTEHSYSGHLSYPFHWLRRSPLSETALFRGPHFLDSRGGATTIAPGDDEASADHFRASAAMTLEAAVANDDDDTEEGEEVDAEEDSDYGHDESGEEATKVVTNHLYTVNDEDEEDDEEGEEEEEEADDDDEGEEEGDDDDSLADLEDYLFYYRTGDLLFGPPSASGSAGCAPYSYYTTTLRDSYATDLWRDLLESSSRDTVGGGGGGLKARRAAATGEDGGKANDSRVDSSSWRTECKELADKVKDLKIRMKDVRTRRMNRCHKTGEAVATQAQPVEDAKTGPRQSGQNSSLDVLANPSRAAAACTTTSLTAAKSEREVGSHSLASANGFDGRRQRRFGTVTPPELNLLVQPSFAILTSQPSGSKQIPDSVPVTTSSSRLHESVPFADGETVVINKPLGTNFQLRPLSGHVPSATAHGETFESRSSGGTTAATQPTRACKSALLLSSFSRLLPSINDHNLSKTSVSSQLVVETNSGLSKTSDRKVGEKSPTSPSKLVSSPNSLRRKRCSLCLRRTGIVNSYSCRCGRNFCPRHRYAELHACPFDYKAEGRRALLESNPVIAAPKLPKI